MFPNNYVLSNDFRKFAGHQYQSFAFTCKTHKTLQFLLHKTVTLIANVQVHYNMHNNWQSKELAILFLF